MQLDQWDLFSPSKKFLIEEKVVGIYYEDFPSEKQQDLCFTDCE